MGMEGGGGRGRKGEDFKIESGAPKFGLSEMQKSLYSGHFFFVPIAGLNITVCHLIKTAKCQVKGLLVRTKCQVKMWSLTIH